MSDDLSRKITNARLVIALTGSVAILAQFGVAVGSCVNRERTLDNYCARQGFQEAKSFGTRSILKAGIDDINKVYCCKATENKDERTEYCKWLYFNFDK